MAIDTIQRDPKVFNALAEGAGILWKDQNGDRLQEEGEIEITSTFVKNPLFRQFQTLSNPRDIIRTMAVQINLELPKAMRMGVELYRQIKEIKDESDSVATVAAYSVRHPQEGETPEEAFTRIHYEYLATLIDANKKGTSNSQPGSKTQLGYLFKTGAIQIGRDKEGQAIIQEKISKVQGALAELKVKMQEIVEKEDKKAAGDLLNLASAIPAEWDREIVPVLAKINGTNDPHRLNRLYVIFVDAPKVGEQRVVRKEKFPLVVEKRPSSACGCAIGARP